MRNRQAGTLTADEALALIGDDPEMLILAIRLMDRMAHARATGTKSPSSMSHATVASKRSLSGRKQSKKNMRRVSATAAVRLRAISNRGSAR